MAQSSSALQTSIKALIGWLRLQHYEFVTVTPATHARVTRRCEHQVARTVRDAFGWNLPFHRDLLPADIFQTLLHGEAIQANGALYQSMIRVSSLGDDLFAHSSFPTAEPDAVFFGPDTYRFASAIQRRLSTHSSIQRAADIGCGTGAAGVLIARLAPDAEVFLADINERALTFAKVNADAAGVTNVKVVRSDIFSQLPGLFDLVVANPPYLVDGAARAYRHGGEMIGTELSLRMLSDAYERLTEQGMGLIYTGAPVINGKDIFKSSAEEFLKARRATWTYEEVDPDVFGEELEEPDYADVERIAVAVLTFAKDER